MGIVNGCIQREDFGVLYTVLEHNYNVCITSQLILEHWTTQANVAFDFKDWNNFTLMQSGHRSKKRYAYNN